MSFLSDRRHARQKRRLARLNPKQLDRVLTDSENMLLELGLIETAGSERAFRITALGKAIFPKITEADGRGLPITKKLIRQLIADVTKEKGKRK